MKNEDKTSLFLEINAHLLQDLAPSQYIAGVSESLLFQEPPFILLNALKKTKQSPLHHPEGSAWQHTMMVVDAAANLKDRSKNSSALMWAALLHDIGKPSTTRMRNGKITSYNHDSVGAEMTRAFLIEFSKDFQFVDQVVSLVRWHMQILFVVKDMPFGDMKTMMQQADIEEVALLGLCDRLGRLGANREQEEQNIRLFIKKCSKA